MAYILSADAATVLVSGKQYTVNSTHPNFTKIVDAIKKGTLDLVPTLADIGLSLKSYLGGKIKIDIDAGVLLFNGEELHSVLVDRIITMLKEGFDVEPMVKFLTNLLDNPSRRAVQELYSFLETGNMPITADGCFLAYKRVTADYKDIHTKTIDNSVGKVIEMVRNQVDEDKNRTCSYGLHFCSLAYIPQFGSGPTSGDKVMIVKINPRDVVAIPSDYNDTKGRCCRYEVIGEYTDIDLRAPAPAWTTSVVNTNEDDVEDGTYIDDSDLDDDELNVTFEDDTYELGYSTGYDDGRDRAAHYVCDGGESQEWIDGYKDGYKDGRGHKKRQY